MPSLCVLCDLCGYSISEFGLNRRRIRVGYLPDLPGIRRTRSLGSTRAPGGVRSQPDETMALESSAYAIGQAVFIRTDTPDYAEEIVPFRNLEEMVQVCSTPRSDVIVEKVVIYAMPGGEPCALTLGFISSTKGQRPGDGVLENEGS